METTAQINRLSSAAQKININYCITPFLKNNNSGAYSSAFLLSILLSILQTIISTNKRRRIPYPRGDGALSLFAYRLILYQRSRIRCKRRKVGLKSPPRSSPQALTKKFNFSPKRAVENILCCKNAERRCV